MYFIADYYVDLYLIALFVFILFVVIMTVKRNKVIYAKYNESLEMSKTMLERQKKSIATAEETNRLLGEVLKALKKK